MTTQKKEYGSGDPVADKLIDALVTHMGPSATDQLIQEIIVSAVKLGKESNDVGDLKLANAVLKELRYAFKVFAPYREKKKTIIFGSARSPEDSPEYIMAISFAREMHKKGFMIVTGGGPGIMEAGNRGAPEGMSFALNIRLPFEQKHNPFVSENEKLINFKYFFTRKLFFIKETDATAVFPGGFGTLDEGFEMLTLMQTGKSKPRPIVLMEPEGSAYWQECRSFLQQQLLHQSYICPSDTDLFTIVASVDEAVTYIERFYRVYHSLRFDTGTTVLRLNREISETTIRRLNDEFSDIITSGEIIPAGPTEHEIHNDEVLHLPRLQFNFNRHDFGRLHKLIGVINDD